MTDAEFWNRIAGRYARRRVANPDAFERKIAVTQALITPQSVVLDIGCGTGSLALRLAPDAAPLLSVRRWFGKAPSVVSLLSKRDIADDNRRAGFVGLSQPDVGAGRMIGFIVAMKPA